VYKTRTSAALGFLPCGLLIACLGLCGCEKTDQITTYTVPKHESLQTVSYLEDFERRHPKEKRMIGVIIPKSPMMWFFKLEGDVEAVAARENDVREFLKSLRFSDTAKIEWTLLNGWKELPAREMRYATILLDGQPPLEMSVIELPVQSDMELDEQILANINRWRGQFSLRPIPIAQISEKTEKLNVNDVPSYWVNIVGRPRPKPDSMAPRQPPAAPKNDSATDKANERPESGAPKYDKPSEWTEGPPAMFAKVSLQVMDGDAKVAITLTQARGNHLDNVNRWRGQVKLEPLTSEQFATASKKVPIGGLTGDLYEITNGERTILGVIVEDQGQTWFVKLDGNSTLAERERPRFEAFLKSLRFE
jgi:hypothetical protein